MLLLVDVPKCQPPTVSLPAILVPWSKSHVRPLPLPVHRHVTSLLGLTMSVDRFCAPHLYTIKPRDLVVDEKYCSLDGDDFFFRNRGLPRFIDHKASSIQFSSESVSARPPTEGLKAVNLSSINAHYKLRTLLIHTNATRRRRQQYRCLRM